jgi:D-alanyl-D-alanine carboxypeptidase
MQHLGQSIAPISIRSFECLTTGTELLDAVGEDVDRGGSVKQHHAQAKYRLQLVVAIVLLLAICAVAVSSCGTGGQSFGKDLQDKLNKAVDAKMAELEVPGAIIGVWVPGNGQWVVTRGKADIITGARPTTSDRVRVGSITKTFTATVVLQLVGEGRLSLDDTIDKVGLRVSVPNGDKITVRNLLNMTSGLYNYTDDIQNFAAKFLADPTKPWTPEQLVEISAAHGAVSPPGQGYVYNNTNFVLLGLIIEKLTGKPAGQEMNTRIIDRLGLKNTSLPATPQIPAPFMNGYMPDLLKGEPPDGRAMKAMTFETPTAFYTAGGMVSNLEDVKTWVRALADGNLLSPELHKEQLKFAPPNTPTYGLGVMNEMGLVGHTGELPGYNSAAYTQTRNNPATIVILLNRYPSKTGVITDPVKAGDATDPFLEAILQVLQKAFPGQFN